MRFHVGSIAASIGVALLFGAAGCASDSQPTLRVGVMLPLTGPDSYDPEPSLRWATDTVNRAGGVAGHALELVYRDIGKLDYRSVAKEFSEDPEIVGMIGPGQSRRVFEVAPQFIRKQKLLISPSSTAADVYRAYAGSGYVWRTTESDMAQIKTMLLIAQAEGANRVSLITSYDPYGATFFDAFGFFAAELGLEVVDVIRYDQGVDSPCQAAMDQGLTGAPDVLFAVPSAGEDTVCLARAYRKAAPAATRLFFTDAALIPYLIEQLGPEAEGLEGTSLAADQGSGYEVAYRKRVGSDAPNFAANDYDAVLLMAYALERSGGRGGPALRQAMQRVVDGRGEATTWTDAGVARTLELLRAGADPDLNGATGPLQFDSEHYTDLTFSTYMHWKVEDGRFETVDEYPTYETGTETIRDNAIFETRASALRQPLLTGAGTGAPVEPREGSWALILASSSGFDNYRHQADALAQYQLLRARGVPDDHIVLILADDLVDSERNPEPGVIRNVAGGDDVYAGAQIDYRLAELGVADILGDVLLGRRSARLPSVLELGANDDLYVFLVGHGGRQGLFYGVDRAFDSVSDSNAVLGPDQLAASLRELARLRGFRRALIVVEACHGGVLGQQLLGLPGVLLISGANPHEDSLSTGYDLEHRIWRADEFAFEFLQRARTTPQLSLATLYDQLYLAVLGSHVSIYNSFAFGDLSLPVADFIRP